MVLDHCSLILTHCPHPCAPTSSSTPTPAHTLFLHSYYVVLLSCIAIQTCVLRSAISPQPPPSPTVTPTPTPKRTLHFRHKITLKGCNYTLSPWFVRCCPQSTILNHRPHLHIHAPTYAHVHACIPTLHSRDVNCHPVLNHSPSLRPRPRPRQRSHTHTHTHTPMHKPAPTPVFRSSDLICIVTQPQNPTHLRQ